MIIINCLTINRWKSILTILVLVIPIDYIDFHWLPSIIICNSWGRIPSISDLLPGLATYIAWVSGGICNLVLSLMCELVVFVEALLYVILKAHAIFISVNVLLAALSVAQAKNSLYTLLMFRWLFECNKLSLLLLRRQIVY